uniref:Peptidase S1 domain-containing protein n=1 Tax=Naja naja TaxID=35670 RepID=A0A8C6X9X8_NAJNA
MTENLYRFLWVLQIQCSVFSLKVWKIVLGATDLSRLPDIAQLRSIKRIIFHQDYNPTTKINDVALIELDNPVIFNDYVQPICLPPVSLDSDAFSICYVSGWNSSGERVRMEGNIGTVTCCLSESGFSIDFACQKVTKGDPRTLPLS